MANFFDEEPNASANFFDEKSNFFDEKQNFFDEDEPEKEEPEDKGFFGEGLELAKHLGAGATRGTLLMGRGGIELADAATNLVGLDDLIDNGEENEAIRWLNDAQESVEGWTDPNPGHFDILASGLGSMVPLAGASIINPALGFAAAGLMGTGEQADILRANREEGVEISEGQEDAAMLLGLGVGFTEMLPIGRMLRGIKRGSKGLSAGISARLKHAAVSGGAEGLQEVSASIMQDLIAKGIYNPEMPVGDSLMQEFITGGEAGAIMDLLLGSLAGRRAKGQLKKMRAGEEKVRAATEKKWKEDAGTFGKLGPDGKPLMLPHLPPVAENPNDPVSVATAWTDRIEDNLGDAMPLSGWHVVEKKNPDGNTFHVEDGRGQQHGPDHALRGEAAILNSMLTERATDRNLHGNVKLSVDQTPHTYTPSVREKLIAFGTRMLHPNSNLISAQQINYAGGTTAGTGYVHEMLSLEEAESKKAPNLTLVQQANKARRKAGKPATNSFTVAEAQKLLGKNFGRIAGTELAHLEPNQQFRAKMRDGKATVGGVLVKETTRKGKKVTRAYQDVGAVMHGSNQSNKQGTATEQVPFKNLAEAKQYAKYLNQQAKDGSLTRADIYSSESVKVADIKDLLLRKNVSNNLQSAGIKAIIKQVTGRSVPVGKLTAGEKAVLYNRLNTLPSFEVKTEVPAYKLSPYTPSHAQIATESLLETGEVLPRPQLEKAAGAITQKAYDRLVKELGASEKIASERKARLDRETEAQAAEDKNTERKARLARVIESVWNKGPLAKWAKLHIGDVARQSRVVDGKLEVGERMFQNNRKRELGTEGAFKRSMDAIFLHVEALESNPEYVELSKKDGVTDAELEAKLTELMLGTLNHETLHLMRNADLFTDREWAMLTNLAQMKNVKGKKDGPTYFQQAQARYPDLNELEQMEEAIAELVRDGLSGDLKVGGTQKGLLNRIKEFIKGLVHLKSNGFKDFDSLIAGIKEGEVGAREQDVVRTPLHMARNKAALVHKARADQAKAKAAPGKPVAETEDADAGPVDTEQSQSDWVESRRVDETIGERRYTKELQGFRDEMGAKINKGVSQMQRATQEATDLGHFDGYEVGKRLQGKSVLTITGHDVKRYQPYRKGNRTFASKNVDKAMDRLGATPSFINIDGDQFIPMLWYTGNNGDTTGQLYLDGVKATGLKVFNGPQSQPDWVESRRADSFYSGLNRTVVNAEGMPKKGKAAPFKAWLDGQQRKGNIKQEERDWMGVDEWLTEQGNVTRDAFQKFVYENQTVLVEDMLGVTAPTKHAGWTLKGGTNYRELLIRLPNVKLDKAQKELGTFEDQFRGEMRNVDSILAHAKGARDIPPDRKAEWEVLRQAVVDAKAPVYRGDHYQEDNVIVHIRFNDRIDENGNKVLFIEEIQSDLHQEGREEGYDSATPDTEGWEALPVEDVGVPEDFSDMYEGALPKWNIYNAAGVGVDTVSAKTAEEALERAKGDARMETGKVPDMPFKQSRSWGLLAMKRMIRYAAEGGYDSVAWTTGEQQQDRYGLTEVVESIKVDTESKFKSVKKGPARTFHITFLESGDERSLREQRQDLDEQWEAAIKNRSGELAKILHKNPEVVRKYYRTLWEQRGGPNSEATIKRMAELEKALDPMFRGVLENPDSSKRRIHPTLTSAGYLQSVYNRFSGDYELDPRDDDLKVDHDGAPHPNGATIYFEDGTQSYTFQTADQADAFRSHVVNTEQIRADYRHIENELEEAEMDGDDIDEHSGMNITVMENESREIVRGDEDVYGKSLDKVVGKAMADKLMTANNNEVIEGEDLKVGGEWAVEFYDKIVPNFVKKFIKKWNSRISGSTISLAEVHANELTGKTYSKEGFEPVFDTAVHSFKVTDSMRDSAMEGTTMFSQRNGIRDEGPADASEVPDYMEMRAWHGSPHKFTWFDLDKVGTGEGFQAFGWGIYFADHKSIGEFYAETLGNVPYLKVIAEDALLDSDFGKSGFFGNLAIHAHDKEGRLRPLDDMIADLWDSTKEDAKGGEDSDPFMRGVAKSILSRWDSLVVEAREAAKGKHNPGELQKYLYEVEIPDDMIERVLQWNKPLTEQPGVVSKLRQFFGQFGNPLTVMEEAGITMKSTGKDVYEAFTGKIKNPDSKSAFYAQKDASQTLKHAGISGIRYLDAISRDDNTFETTMNTVLFDMKGIEVLKRNGDPISKAKMVEDQVPNAKVLQEEGGLTDTMFSQRLDDAQNQGFDINNVWYTGRKRLVKKFKSWRGPAVYITLNPTFAGNFTGVWTTPKGQKVLNPEQVYEENPPARFLWEAGRRDRGPVVYPLFQKVKNTFDARNELDVRHLLDFAEGGPSDAVLEFLNEGAGDTFPSVDVRSSNLTRDQLANWEMESYNALKRIESGRVDWGELEVLIPYIKAAGYDSHVDYEDIDGDATGMAVYNAGDVKGVYANFDPDGVPEGQSYDDDIMHSRRDPADVEQAVALNASESENAIKTGWIPYYSTSAEPEAQFVARNPEAARTDGYMFSAREPEFSPSGGAAINAVTGPVPKSTHPMDKFNSIDSLNDMSKRQYLWHKLRAATTNRFDRLEWLNGTEALRDNLADASSIAAMHQMGRAMGIMSGAVKIGPPVYHAGWTSTPDQSVADDLASRGHPMSLPADYDLSRVQGLIDVQGPLQEGSNEYGNLERVAQAYAIHMRAGRIAQDGKVVPITPAQSADILAEVEKYIDRETGENIIKKWWADYQHYNEGIIKYMKATGVLTDETAKLWMDHASYYPFYRKAEGADGEVYEIAQKVFGGMTAPVHIKRLKGHEEPVNMNLTEAITLNINAAIQMGMKNVAQQRTARDMVEIGLGRELGEHESTNENVVEFRVKGKKKRVVIYDPLVWESLQSLGSSDLVAGVRKTFGLPATWLRELVTRDPAFMLVNLVRDSMSAAVTSGAAVTPLYGTAKGFLQGVKGVKTLEALGVVGGYDYSNDPDDLGKFMEKEYRTAGYKDGSALNIVTKVWDFLGKGTTMSDGATRRAVFDDVYSRTGNYAHAAYQAMEIINFGRHGSNPGVRVVTAVIPFLNARIQGLDVFYRAFAGQYSSREGYSKQRIATAAMTRMSMLIGMNMAYFMAVGDDDQYKMQPDFVKDNNWIIPTPSGVPIKIPTPFEVGMFGKTFPEAVMARYMSGKESGTGDKYDVRTMDEVGGTLARGIETTLGVSMFAPQFAGPLLEAMVNKDAFTGRQIVPYYMDDGRNPEAQYEVYTDELAKWLGGKFGLSPMLIEHVYEGYGGTIGGYFINGIDHALKSETVQGDRKSVMAELPWHKWPMIKRFAADPSGRAAIQDFYDLYGEVHRAYGDLKKMREDGDIDKARAYMQDHQIIMSMKGSLDNLKKTVDTFRKFRKLTLESDMDPARKRSEIEAIDLKVNMLLDHIMPIMKERAGK